MITTSSTPQKIRCTGYLKISLNPYPRQSIVINSEIYDELFSMLEYYAEIPAVGIKYIKSLGHHSDYKKSHALYRGFIRQARLYYEAALNQSFRISALNYYYAFLNLTKAYLVLMSPHVFKLREMYHGLVYRHKQSGFENQTLKVKKGVFKYFYDKYTGVPLSINKCLNISHLLSYCTDISVEYSQLGYGESRSLIGQCVLVINNPSREAWSIISINRGREVGNYPKTIKPFRERFQEVDLNKMQVKELFGISPFDRDRFDYYESKKKFKIGSLEIIPLHDVGKYSYEPLKKIISPNLYENDFEFFISLPYRKNNQLPMREALAIYACVYFISSLVRYSPDNLDKLLETKHMYLIKRFLKNSPVTFLRYMTAAILKRNVVLIQR